MKIAILKSNAGAMGGLELYTKRLAEAFAKDHDVTLLTSGSVEESSISTLSVCETSKFSWHHLRRFDAQTQAWISKNRPDMVFGMERNSFQTHYRAGSGVHAAYLRRRSQLERPLKKISFALNPLHRKLLELEKCAFEHPQLKKLFVNSQMVREEIVHYYNTDPSKIIVVHNGVDWESALATAQNEQYHFLFVGNDFRRKGLEKLLLGLRGLKNYRLTIVGKDKRQRYYEELAKSLGIAAHFVGPQREMKPFYEAADCLVLPTLYDPFANVTLEALAHGLFVITSPSNGGKEVLTAQSGIVTENWQEALFKAQHYRRDPQKIRESVRTLTFENQLKRIVEQC